MPDSISYYNQNSDAFFDRTVNADMATPYKKFLSLMPEKSHILDAGCGVGRDGKYFKECGYTVTLFDASDALIEKAKAHTGQDVLKLKFQDLDFQETFHAVWAAASLLHVPYSEMSDVFEKIHRSLKPGGIFYASFKRGDSDMVVKNRHFYNMNEEKITPYLSDLFDVVSLWSNEDGVSQVAPSPEKKWFNLLCKKK